MSTLANLLIFNTLNHIVSELHKQKGTKIDKCIPPVNAKYFLKWYFSTTYHRF